MPPAPGAFTAQEGLSNLSASVSPRPPLSAPQSRTSQRLVPAATWGRPGKPTSPRPSGRCGRLPAPRWTPRLRWSRTEFLSLLGPVLKAWSSPSPCIPHTPPPRSCPYWGLSPAAPGKRYRPRFPSPQASPGLAHERGSGMSPSQDPGSIFGHHPRPHPAGALSGLERAQPALPSRARARAAPAPRCRPPLPGREREPKVRSWASSAVTPERARRALHKRHGSLGYYLTNTLWPPRAHLSPSVAGDLAHPDLRALRLRLLGTRVSALTRLSGVWEAPQVPGREEGRPTLVTRALFARGHAPLCPRGPRHLARGPCKETRALGGVRPGGGHHFGGWRLQREAWEQSA